jgi:hypothetical protein
MKNMFFVLLLFTNEIFSQSDNFIVDAMVNPMKPAKVITVGGLYANIQGFTNEDIQQAVDALYEGGGTVKLSQGLFETKAPVRLSSNIKLVGSVPQTILRRTDGVTFRDEDF